MRCQTTLQPTRALPARQVWCTDLGGLAPNVVLTGSVACILLVVTDHARRRQFVLNALLHRQTDVRLERLTREQGVEKRKDRELLMAMTFHEVRNPLNGTLGHLRLTKQLVAGMRRGDGNELAAAL